MSALADVSLLNFYGTGKMEGNQEDLSNIESTALANGPWVLVGGGNDKNNSWKAAFARSSDPDTTVNCGAARLIGPVPSSVVPKS